MTDAAKRSNAEIAAERYMYDCDSTAHAYDHFMAGFAATLREADKYENDVVEPNREIYGSDVEASRDVLKRYRKGQWHINGAIVREALDAAYKAQPITFSDAAVEAAMAALERSFGGLQHYRIVGDDPNAAMRAALEAALAVHNKESKKHE